MGLKVADLFAELSLKDQGFERDLEKKKGLLGGLGPMAAKAGLAVGGALAAAAAKGVVDFSGFQRQMNEVFTLLPGMTGDAMKAMEGQVKGFSKEFGVLPDKVVPALYQSLSAGVPEGNVFDFLETANMAAKGGVAELDEAVSALSSVTNAYGSDVLSTAEASDLMFTAVKKGVTTFPDLGANLSKVTPLAAALGVSFGDVTAAIATMTSQGEGTAESTTKIRALFTELSQAGGATAKVFEEVAGKPFQQFVTEGGNVQEALQLMEGAARDNGVQIQDLFGSVEAGGAAMMLTGGAAEAFSGNLEAMADSAGATQGAFEQMETGIGPVFDKLKANAAVAFLEIGDRLAPVVEQLGNLALNALPMVADAFDTFMQGLAPLTGLFDTVSGAIGKVTEGEYGLVEAFKVGTEWSGEVFEDMSMFEGLMSMVGGAFVQARDVIMDALGKAREFIDDHMGQITAIFEGAIELVMVAWNLFGDDLLTFLSRTFDALMTIVGGALDIIQGIFETVLGILTGDWSRAWDGIKQIFSGAWQVMIGLLERAWATIQLVVGVAFDALRAAVGGGVERVLDFFREMPGNIREALGDLGGLLRGAARELIDGFIGGIKAKFADVRNTLGELTGKLTSWKGPASVDRKLLWGPAELMMEGMAERLAAMADAEVRPVLAGLTASMPDIALGGVAGGLSTGAGVSVSPNIRVFLGDREIRDVVRIEVDDMTGLTGAQRRTRGS